MKQRKVAILIFDDVEVLDFCGPFEVFAVAGLRSGKTAPFKVYTVGQHSPVVARGGLSVNPHYTFENCPQPDILVIPGGGGQRKDGTPFGTRREMNNPVVLEWIQQLSPTSEQILSVCTGALIVGKAGLADGLKATTHHLAFGELRKVASNTTILEEERVVDNGQIVFSGGVSAGIDAAFHIVGKLLGQEVAEETAKYIEYKGLES